MPNVTATPRRESNGDVTTYFIGVIGSTSATYTYPMNQDTLKFINRSVSSSMTLTVNGTAYTVSPDSSIVVYASFTSFTVVSQTDSQAFDTTATARLSDDVQVTNSNLQENPFGTPYGQTAVSEEENFWARLARVGRWRTATTDGTGASASLTASTLTMVKTLDVSKGCMFYPKTIIISSNVDALLHAQIDTKIPYVGGIDFNGIMYYRAQLKAFTPFVINFDGELWADELGQVAIGINPIAIANLVCIVFGVEVAK